jgi:hypothetical protein
LEGFLLAGAVKDAIEFGFPTVSLGLLTAALDLTIAIALLIVSSFVSNFWQAVIGGNGLAILLRFWPFLLMAATASVWFGTTVGMHLFGALCLNTHSVK